MAKKRISCDVDADFHALVKTKAAKQGKKIKEINILLLEKWLKEGENKKHA